ncbi:MAG: Na/Pi cotransporter family protein [Erysipelotrichaceae bacterium]
MQITDFLSLLSGLSLFLYGMHMMSYYLEAAAGDKIKDILNKLTANRFLGVGVGALITAIIQSSSATTVMVVGFVNAKLMTLKQAVWIIMGANIGTTITGQLIALDVGAIAPLFAFIGVACVVFLKKEQIHNYGQIIAGLGFLFIGMEIMSASMVPLRDSATFINLMTTVRNPLLGVLLGLVFTAIIQSSSASVGILQALALSGLVDLHTAVFILFGQNIGTCVTALLSSIGSSNNAKRSVIIHFLFNIIGTIVFFFIALWTPFVDWMISFTPTNVASQIANTHTVFNVVTTLLLLPIGDKLVNLAYIILPKKAHENNEQLHLEYINNEVNSYQLGHESIILSNIKKEMLRMMELIKDNISLSYDLVIKHDRDRLKKINDNEEYINYLNIEIGKYISDKINRVVSAKDGKTLSSYLKIVIDLERIGDHCVNLSQIKPANSDTIIEEEIMVMKNTIMDFYIDIENLDQINSDKYQLLEDKENNIDDITINYRNNQLKRIQELDKNDEFSMSYFGLLIDFERMGDHIINIGQELANK